jgi:hypothetical protein
MCTYKKLKAGKVPMLIKTEPAIQELLDAKRVKDEREKSKSDSKAKFTKQDYLDSIKDELQARSRGIKYQIYEMGKLLHEAKKLLPHGTFKKWINDNFEFCYRTAFNFMQVYRFCMGQPEVVRYFKPSSLYIIARPDFPNDLRQALFHGVKGPVDIKEKDLVKIALKYKNGQLKTTDQEVQNLLKKYRDISRWENLKVELVALKQLIQNRRERIEQISDIHSVNHFIIKDDDEKEIDKKLEEYTIVEQIKNLEAKVYVMIRELDEKCK